MATMMSPPATLPGPARPRAIATWLWVVAALVFAMVVVGGITRLTESGLSITEWKPVSGAIPPLSDAQWQAEFDKYRATPEYQQINRGMSLSAFKFIFFWEYVHRLLGRLIGIAFAVPLIGFAARRAIPRGYGWRLTALFALGGLQGVLGWWMVESGLSLRTDVSHFRLAAHLLTALLILAGLVWTALDLRRLAADPGARPARLRPLAIGVAAILFVQLLLGAWTAGLNAGLVTREWPLMNGRLVPIAEWQARPFWDAVVNDPWVVHFLHRWWAWVTVVALIVLARAARSAGHRSASVALHAAFGTQIVLGVLTVWTGVDITLAVLHQAVGALVVASTAWAAHAIGRAA